MTELEAKAAAMAHALGATPKAWAKAEADSAGKFLMGLLQAGQIDAATFASASLEVMGNHSAMKQLLEKHGIMANTAAKPALIAQLEVELAKLRTAPTPEPAKPKAK